MIATEIVLFLRDVVVALFHLLTGKGRRRYETSIFIPAPRELVWSILRSKDLTLGGLVPMRVVTEDVPGKPDLERARVAIGPREITMTMRRIEERPGEALLMELLEEGSDPAVVAGLDDRIGYALLPVDGGTSLYMTRELTPTRWHGGFSIPFGLRRAGRWYLAKADALKLLPPEQHAAAMKAPPGSTAKPASDFGLSANGILLGLAALASFTYLWGFEQALILAAIIILHELGHAMAMLLAGIPVKGVYLVPFFGGAAVAGAPYRSEGQIGFVALMGPAFSLIPTFALAYAAQETGSDAYFKATQISTYINLFNLVPILPLDGGHVLKAALVSVNRTIAYVAGMAGIAAGFYAAWLLGDPVLGVFVALGLLVTRQIRNSPAHEPMRWPAVVLLLASFGGTIAAYLAILRFASEGFSIP